MPCGGCRKRRAEFQKKLEAKRRKKLGLPEPEPEKTPRQIRIEARAVIIRPRVKSSFSPKYLSAR